jgi:methionyl aminopeptidase
MDKQTIKSEEEIKIMAEGGAKLARIKQELEKNIKEDGNAFDIENLAVKLIEKEGGEASFKMVPGYSWATCINLNKGLVHGIPLKNVVFKKGDVVSVDIGFFYKNFHTDTSFTVGLRVEKEIEKFLEAGKRALVKAIQEVSIGKRIYDISGAIQDEIEKNGYSPIKALVGHGVGKHLHEEPQVPCFRIGERQISQEIINGLTLAIEVMYAMGSSEVVFEPDGWTISMRDGKISALYEETVAATTHGPFILTEA